MNDVASYAIVCVKGDDYVRVHYDGEVEYSGSPSDAAKLFWNALKPIVAVVDHDDVKPE